MAGVRRKRLAFSVFVFFAIAYLIFLLPIFPKIDFLHLLNILFLSFNEFEALGLSKLNPQYFILFFMMFYTLYQQQLSVINENTSFLSMGLHKMKKKRIILNIFIENGYDNMIVFVSSIITIVFIYFLSALLLDITIRVDFDQIFKIILYLVKFDLYLFVMIVMIRILNIIRMSNYYILIPYVGLVVFAMFDYGLGTSLITIAKTWQMELIFFGFMIGLSLLILVILYFKIYRGKEIYND